MTATRMPNGQYVDIPAGADPAVVERIKSQYRRMAPVMSDRSSLAPDALQGRSTAQSAPMSPPTASQRLTSEYKAGLDNKHGIMDVPIVGSALKGLEAFTHEVTFHADDQLEAAAEAALPSSAARADPSLKYNDRRKAILDGIREHRATAAQDAPIATTAGAIFGMAKAPLGMLGKGAGFAGKTAANLATRTGARGAVDLAAKAGARIAPKFAGAVGQGALQGAGQAGLTTLIDTGDLGKTTESALGGATGGAAGGALLGHVLPGVMGVFRDRGAGEAERVAYEKIAAMLGRAKDENGAAFTPKSATGEISASRAAGTPAVLGDLSHELTGYRGELARHTALPSSGNAASEATDRLGSAADRFETRIKALVDPATGRDALALKSDVDTLRKAQAKIDYAKGGAMDDTLAPTPELLKAINSPPSYLSRAIAEAKDVVANDPALPKWGHNVAVGGKILEMPTLRSFDAIKKAMDDQIEAGIKHLPDGSKIATNPSRIASLQLRALKDMVAQSNPEYGQILARQRDAYEMIDSVNTGKDFIKSMRASPREVLAKLKLAGAAKPEHVRTGLVDALLSMRNTTSSPVKILRSWEKNRDQRAVLEHIMGGSQNFNEFSKFMRRELRSMQGDESVLRGSKHPVLDDFAEHGEASDVRRTMGEVARGQAYGGITGSVSAGVRAVDRLKSGLGPHAQDKLLGMLGGEGRGLEKGVEAARAYRAVRKAAALKRARAAGRVIGGAVSSLNGTGE